MPYVLQSLLGLAGITIMILYIVLAFVSNWKVFVKYGESGWKCLIPIYNLFVECKRIWSTAGAVFLLITTIIASCYQGGSSSTVWMIIAGLAALAVLVLYIVYSHYKARAFGKGVGMTLVLIFFPFIGNLVLGLGSAEYIGNPLKK